MPAISRTPPWISEVGPGYQFPRASLRVLFFSRMPSCLVGWTCLHCLIPLALIAIAQSCWPAVAAIPEGGPSRRQVPVTTSPSTHMHIPPHAPCLASPPHLASTALTVLKV